MLVGEKIQKLRKAKHLTQDELGKIIDTDGNTVSRWERNKLGVGSSYIAKLAAALNTTTDYLLNGESPESRESLPINNAPMEVAPDYLDLGYWGNVAENASRAARSGDKKKIALITPLVKSAFEVLFDAELSDDQEKNSQSFIGIHGDNSEIRNNSVNVNTG